METRFLPLCRGMQEGWMGILQRPGRTAGSRTDSNVKGSLAGEKVLLMGKIKASYKEKKRE